jgi:transposase
MLVSTIKKQNTLKLPVSIMFQDEARFGRMSIPVSCWAPMPYRPVVNYSIIRQFRYVYASVCPKQGRLYFMITDKMNTINMNTHLKQISMRKKSEFIILIVDGASSHTSKNLVIPENISLLKLPPYSPELNPTEQIWRMLRGDYFGNKIFDTVDAAINQARQGLMKMASDHESIIQLTNWPWISKALTKIDKLYI